MSGRKQLRVRGWRGGNVDLWIDEYGDFGIRGAEARRSLVIYGSDIQKIVAWLGGTSLTESEREAVEQAIDAANGMGQAEPWTMRTLRGLLERLK